MANLTSSNQGEAFKYLCMINKKNISQEFFFVHYQDKSSSTFWERLHASAHSNVSMPC